MCILVLVVLVVGNYSEGILIDNKISGFCSGTWRAYYYQRLCLVYSTDYGKRVRISFVGKHHPGPELFLFYPA